MRLAMYKGKNTIFNIVTSWWLGGEYSHCEIVFSDGICASSSFRDSGVRFKYIDINTNRWDILEIEGDEETVREWFYTHSGEKYDILGLIGFLIRPIKGIKHRWVCSEAIAEALGYKDSWRFDPCILASVIGIKNA